MDVDHTNLLEALRQPGARNDDPAKHRVPEMSELKEKPPQKEPRG